MILLTIKSNIHYFYILLPTNLHIEIGSITGHCLKAYILTGKTQVLYISGADATKMVVVRGNLFPVATFPRF